MTSALQAPPGRRRSDPLVGAPSRADLSRHTRLLLQLQGPESARRHIARSTSRILSLAAIDAGSYFVLRGLIRLLRDDALLGERIAAQLSAVFPFGSLGGAKFVSALLLGLFAFGTYGRGDSRRDPSRIAHGVSAAVALTLWANLWTDPFLLVVFQGLIILAVMWCGITLGRLLFDLLLHVVFRTTPGREPVVFVGDRSDPDATRTHELLLGHALRRQSDWVDVPGHGAHGNGGTPEPTERLIQRLHAALQTARAQTIVLCGELPKSAFEAVVEAATSAGIRVLAAARVSGVSQRRTGLVMYNGAPFVELTVPGLVSWQQVLKRALDIVLTTVGLVALAPIFALIAVAIKLDSRGPVFFTQERAGYAGRVFHLWKFRTMRQSAEAEKATLAHLNASGDDRLFKIPGDPRVTRVGAFLRRWSLDELPQFFNVLRGDMSLVGPRPFFEKDLRSYLDHHFARLGAKPGITGLWQVKGRSDVMDFEEVVRLDREYIERWSVALDLWILGKTIPAVVRGRGAY